MSNCYYYNKRRLTAFGFTCAFGKSSYHTFADHLTTSIYHWSSLLWCNLILWGRIFARYSQITFTRERYVAQFNYSYSRSFSNPKYAEITPREMQCLHSGMLPWYVLAQKNNTFTIVAIFTVVRRFNFC